MMLLACCALFNARAYNRYNNDADSKDFEDPSWAPAPENHTQFGNHNEEDYGANWGTTIDRTKAEWFEINKKEETHGKGTRHISWNDTAAKLAKEEHDGGSGADPTGLDGTGATAGVSAWDNNTLERSTDFGSYPTHANCGTYANPRNCSDCDGAGDNDI